MLMEDEKDLLKGLALWVVVWTLGRYLINKALLKKKGRTCSKILVVSLVTWLV
jgi:hypothetical protein